MKRTHRNHSRAPQPGSSSFFTSKRERVHQNAQSYYGVQDEHIKYKSPKRAKKRQYELKTSKLHVVHILIKSYEDLTLIKNFILFLKRKQDLVFRFDDDVFLDYKYLEVTEEDIRMYEHYREHGAPYHQNDTSINIELGMTMAFDNLHVKVQIYRLTRSFRRIIYMQGAFSRSSMIGSLPEHRIIDMEYDRDGHSLKNFLTELLTLINQNIKHPVI